jgi:Ca2+-dependent lipid-binding protein
MDSNGLSDPYVKVKLPVESMSSSSALMDKETRKSARKKNKDGKDFIVYTSKVHYKNLNPEFNARFEFSPASEQSKVIIELFDVDSTFPIGTKSNFMGNLEVPIATILEHGGSMEARFKVGNAKSGELDIAFNWQSYS